MQDTQRRTWYRRMGWKKFWLRLGLLAIFLMLSVMGWIHWRLRGSLPQLTGEISAPGIATEVEIERDVDGIPTIKAKSRTDAAYALGFLHAQDRFFQMDLTRRLAGGRLSELFGERAVSTDESYRKHRFASLAVDVVNTTPENYRAVLDAYTLGVNHGLHQLGGQPYEYLLLGQKPMEWHAADCILVMLSMMCDLQPMDGSPELSLGVLHERVPEEVFRFLVPQGSAWDAALDASMYPPPALPGAEIWSLRDAQPLQDVSASYPRTTRDAWSPWGSPSGLDGEFRIGSNSFAVGPGRSKEGVALLASDMHLGLRLPATWYRVVVDAPTIRGMPRVLAGVTLPGTPLLIEGSNGEVAWGFTNSYGDFGDIIELKAAPELQDQYLTPDGPEQLIRHSETISFPEGTREIEYFWSKWGPVVAEREGRRFVHRWVGHDWQAFDLRGIELESTTTVEETLQVANEAGMPHVNILAVDAAGNIGWTVCGRVPLRPTAPPIIPVDWSTADMNWQEYLPPNEYPRLVNPADGILWTANNRIMGDSYLQLIGNGGYDRGARARQIRDRLQAQATFNEQDLLDIQLDDEAIFLQRWQALLLETAAAQPAPVSQEFIDQVTQWEGRASVTSVGYRLTREFRQQIINRVFGFRVTGREGLGKTLATPGAFAAKTGITDYVPIAFEDAVWVLVTQQPMHWLAPEYSDWQDLLAKAATDTERELTREQPLASATWGQRNLVQVNHPLSGGIPLLASWLNMPPTQLPGDNNMPRVQGPTAGASQRMVVSPGRENQGIYHQPGGPSGHPYSPFYRSGFDDWCEGRPSPLLPGPPQQKLTLKPVK